RSSLPRRALPLDLITASSAAAAGAWAGSSCPYARRPRADQTYAQLPASTGQYRRFCAESARGAACGGSAVEASTRGEGGGCSAVERVLQPVGGGRERLVRSRRIDRHELIVGARVAAEAGQFVRRAVRGRRERLVRSRQIVRHELAVAARVAAEEG